MIKGLEALQELMNSKSKIKNYYIIRKELKALEIIKDKIKIGFDDHYFGFKNNYYIIVNNDLFGAIRVDKEHFDLLKEVLK